MARNVGAGQGVGGGAPLKYDKAFCDALADDLMKFAEDEKSISLMGFTAKTGFIYTDWRRFSERSDKFCMALSRAKAIIGYRREVGAANGTFISKMLGMNSWQYDPETRAREDELKKEAMQDVIPAQLAAQATIAAQAKLLEDLQKQLSELTK